ncbi:flagellar protein FlaG [Thiorhodovibrio winogradskyi]|uniref:Flagellar protein FlaG n=1 Tax=Thiorhodovibrio winogradskyi TaxID=77007 RepID=A0ABZ0SDC4_9GAMM|nr:flagellar protein FlaG [Thiorhodovibrio winogradskyi]
METLQGLTGLTSPNPMPRRDTSDQSTKGAAPTEMQPPANSAASAAPQVVMQPGESGKTNTEHRGQNDQPPPREELEGAVQQINKFVESMQRSLEFALDEEGEQMVVKIKDADGEVVKQLPPESVLELRRRLTEVEGMIFKDPEGFLVKDQA